MTQTVNDDHSTGMADPVILTKYERIAIIQTRAMELRSKMKPAPGFVGEIPTCPISLALMEYDQAIVPYQVVRRQMETEMSRHQVPESIRLTKASTTVLDNPERRLDV